MKKLTTLVCVLAMAGLASAAPTIELIPQASPGAGADAYILRASSSAGDAPVNAFTAEIAEGYAHQVWSFNGQSRDLDESEGDSLFDNSWLPFDTHCLFTGDEFITTGVDAYAETNDGTDPLALGLTSPLGETFDPTVGLGGYTQIGAALNASGDEEVLDILYLVVPAGTVLAPDAPQPILSGEAATPGTGATQFSYGVPEPATLSVLALGGLALIRRRR